MEPVVGGLEARGQKPGQARSKLPHDQQARHSNQHQQRSNPQEQRSSAQIAGPVQGQSRRHQQGEYYHHVQNPFRQHGPHGAREAIAGVLGEDVGPIGVSQSEPGDGVGKPPQEYVLGAGEDGRDFANGLPVHVGALQHDPPAQPPENEAHVVGSEGSAVETEVAGPQLVPGRLPAYIETGYQENQERRRQGKGYKGGHGEHAPLQRYGAPSVDGRRLHVRNRFPPLIVFKLPRGDAWPESRASVGRWMATESPSPGPPATSARLSPQGPRALSRPAYHPGWRSPSPPS